MNGPDVVVKVGGSLYDLPDLGPRLRRWLAALPTRQVLIVPGGGPTTDVIRVFDRIHALGEERSHDLALQALTLNAHLLALLLEGEVVAGWGGVAERPQVLDAWAVLRNDEVLARDWSTTSDSVAARVAEELGARELVLLKSAEPPTGDDWREAGRRGYVDSAFADTISRAPALIVRAVDFRKIDG